MGKFLNKEQRSELREAHRREYGFGNSFKKKVLYNQYYLTFSEFRNGCLSFFSKSNLGKFKKELTSLLTDNFQIVSA